MCKYAKNTHTHTHTKTNKQTNKNKKQLQNKKILIFENQEINVDDMYMYYCF